MVDGGSQPWWRRIPALGRSLAFRSGLIRLFWRYRHVLDGSYRGSPSFTISSDPHRFRLCEILASLRCQSLLEVGCADGANLSVFASHLPMCTLSAIDLNRRAVQLAEDRIRKIGGTAGTFRTGSANRLPFADKCVDAVLSDAVFMYLTPSHAIQALREMRRVARRVIVIHTFTDESLELGKLIEGNWVHPLERLLSELSLGGCIKTERSLNPSDKWSRYGTTLVCTY